MTILQFRKIVWAHAKECGRHGLPWRSSRTSAYQVLVSEIMLQQTQVDRVIPFYRNFLKQFPTVRALADAPLGDVLRAWQGLGYNRRAKMLHEAAKKVVAEHGGKLPRTPEVLEKLPGIGPYTARAVAAFAHNQDVVFVETNLRTVVIHHFFPDKEKVADADILSLLTKALPKGRAREWYAALMDYGAHLKRTGIRTNSRTKGYMKQSTFIGSLREARGAILKALHDGPKTEKRLMALLDNNRTEQITRALSALLAEGMVVRRMRSYALPGVSPQSAKQKGVRQRAR
jgi:A/G-specific adenine glycosylase